MSNRSYPSGDHDLLFAELGIAEESLILDVGGGANPFRFASVVVDMDFGAGNSHRDGSASPIKREGIEYVQADIHNLPFREGAFDFVISLHVLEHAECPAKACDELMRVGRSGFLETPRKWTEFYAGHPTHRWLVDLVDGRLTFEPVEYNDSPFLNFALPPLWDSDALQRRLFRDFSDIPCVQVRWGESGFSYSVLGDEAGRTGCLPERLKNPSFIAESHYCFARNLLKWMGRSENGAFHAETALSMVPDNEKYRRMAIFYRILTTEGISGMVRQSGGDLRLLFNALICRIMRFLGFKALTIFRKMSSTASDVIQE